MANRIACVMATFAAVMAFSMTAAGSVVYIGGPGAISTSEPPNGPLGLLSGGEVATATLDYSVTGSGHDIYLSLTVTNTSPAVHGSDSGTGIDAPVVSDIMFQAPCVVSNMTLLTVNGNSAGGTGWLFSFDRNDEPSSGFGFLKGQFDAFVDGGPPQKPSPVIASIFDPFIADGPGKPTYPSPVTFVFKLSFVGCSAPQGLTADWFVNKQTLGCPTYVAAAKFMSGANGGSGTVTSIDDVPPVPAPASLLLALVGLLGLRGRFRESIEG